MKLKCIALYDYKERIHFFNLQDKEISYIEIKVVSGDEIANIVYEDKTTDSFDSDEKKTRTYDDLDAFYRIETEEQYNKFTKRTYSYACLEENN